MLGFSLGSRVIVIVRAATLTLSLTLTKKTVSQLPMEVSELGTLIEIRPALWNARLPMDVTPPGRVIDARDEVPSKA